MSRRNGNGLAAVIESFLTDSVRPSSRRVYAHVLSEFFNGNGGLRSVTPRKVRSYVRNLGRRGIRESTINQRVSCLRKFFEFARGRGLVDGNPVDRSKDRFFAIPSGQGNGPPADRAMERAIAACGDGTVAGIRDACVLSLAFREGMPPHRIAGLRRKDLRGLSLTAETRGLLRDLDRFRDRFVNGREHEFVFFSLSNRRRGEALSPGAINDIVKSRSPGGKGAQPVTARDLSIRGRMRRWKDEISDGRTGGRGTR
ncbi:MAG: tyrosine-type recombinase/integrase [Planctomycetota bacterium]